MAQRIHDRTRDRVAGVIQEAGRCPRAPDARRGDRGSHERNSQSSHCEHTPFCPPTGGRLSWGTSQAGSIGKRLARQIAVSEYVAGQLEFPPDAVIPNAVPSSPTLWKVTNRRVLVLQRLELEKSTLTALQAWQASHLSDEGWDMRIVGSGVSEGLPAILGKEPPPSRRVVCGLVDERRRRVPASAGLLLAPAPAEPFGFSVVEAMAAGVPVVACAGGGHLETIGLLPEAAMFARDDADQAAAALRSLLDNSARSAASLAGRKVAEDRFDVSHHVDRLLDEYRSAMEMPRSNRRRSASSAPTDKAPEGIDQLVVCSLEAWDQVWRRNQFFVDILLRRNPKLRILFVEPPADPLFEVLRGNKPTWPQIRTVTPDRRLRALRPLKPLPRRFGALSDALVRTQVTAAAKALGFSHPTLWINDVTFAPLIQSTGWPTLYDVTDDWLLAPFPPRELERLARLDRLATDGANEVVVCSPALARTRGATRKVSIVTNGVDVQHFRRHQERPKSLPDAPVAVYVGTLNEARLDVGLVALLGDELPDVNIALVGPDALAAASRRQLASKRNITLSRSTPLRRSTGVPPTCGCHHRSASRQRLY